MSIASTQTQPADAATRGRRRMTRALTVVGAAAATLVLWIIVDPLAGVELTVHSGDGGATRQVGPGSVLLATLAAGLAGWALLALLERFTRRARAIWTAVAVIVLALSLANPLNNGETTATKVVLTAMHLIAAAVLIPLLIRSSARRS